MNPSVIIIGGGLSGLVSAILLREKGLSVTLIEKKSWPFHRVCGEYISNEVLPLLQRIGVDPFLSGAVSISRFRLTSPDGFVADTPLPLGGFGISRYTLDYALMKKGLSLGVEFLSGTEVSAVNFDGKTFEVEARTGKKLKTSVVLGAFGKRSGLDRVLDRSFFRKKSPYLGVKYHMDWDVADDLVELHTFHGGYCGVSKVEENRTNVCYMIERSLFKAAGGMVGTERDILGKNPFLREVFTKGEKLFAKPVTINEISFARKSLVAGQILMIGDAAGMITPLCGNGMAMAVRSGWMVAPWVEKFVKGEIDRNEMVRGYTSEWKTEFRTRLWLGRKIQSVFGNTFLTNQSVRFLGHQPQLLCTIVRQTHGKPFGNENNVSENFGHPARV
ncbi:MAG: NAD(P)/FAD-dependent oxidoreductase [Bacteroidia bacterium]|nr:NAD(P)/FAD-dependent oxidoreductase [Bacteroidia bacterium]